MAGVICPNCGSKFMDTLGTRCKSHDNELFCSERCRFDYHVNMAGLDLESREVK